MQTGARFLPRGLNVVPFWVVLGCSGDLVLVSRLSNGPYGASYGSLRGLKGDTKWTY